MNGRSNGLVLLTWLANLTALGLVGWVAYDGWQRVLAPQPAVEPPPVASRPAPQRQVVDMRAIVNAHLFGHANAVVRTRPQPVEAPPTRLNLHLVGIVASDDDSRARALIEVGRGQHEVIAIGQQIGDTDAVLDRVHSDHVLILRNDQVERLPLERPELGEEPAPDDPRGRLAAAGRGGDNAARTRLLERLREEDAARLEAISREAQSSAAATTPTVIQRMADVIAGNRDDGGDGKQDADEVQTEEPPEDGDGTGTQSAGQNAVEPLDTIDPQPASDPQIKGSD